MEDKRPTRTEIIEAGVRLWAQQHARANCQPVERATTPAGQLDPEVEQGRSREYRLVCVWSERDKTWLATCPAFPGLSAFGDSKADALIEGRIALDLFIKTYEDDGTPLPDFDSDHEAEQQMSEPDAEKCAQCGQPKHWCIEEGCDNPTGHIGEVPSSLCDACRYGVADVSGGG